MSSSAGPTLPGRAASGGGMPTGPAAGGTVTKPRPPTGSQARRSSGLTPSRGRRLMREYPLTDSDLHDLRNIGIGAVFFFTVGGIAIGAWSNIVTSMAFVTGAPKE